MATVHSHLKKAIAGHRARAAAHLEHTRRQFALRRAAAETAAAAAAAATMPASAAKPDSNGGTS